MAIPWHYTTAKCFRKIVQDGVIRPATEGLDHGERPAVWFSLNEIWEETACKGRIVDGVRQPLDRDGTARYGGGLVRIGVAPVTAPHDWPAFQRTSGIRPVM